MGGKERIPPEYGNPSDFRKIGRGGFGVCYMHTEKKFVVKIVEFIDKKSAAEEVHILQELNANNCPNIVQISDFKIYESYLVIKMPYYEKTLQQLIIENNLTPKRVRIISYNCLLCLRYIHEHKQPIIHRDIKPGNIFIMGNNIAVADFGAARFVSDSNETLTHIGTRKYEAPEVITGKYNCKCDIYSLGCTIYEMVTRRIYTEAKHEIMPSEVGGDIFLAAVLNKMLSEDSRYRPTALQCLQLEYFNNPNDVIIYKIQPQTLKTQKAQGNNYEDVPNLNNIQPIRASFNSIEYAQYNIKNSAEIGPGECALLNIRTVTILNNIKVIRERAFYGAIINEIRFFKPMVETIGNFAFSHSTLSNIKIPSSVKAIGSQAFAYTPLNEIKFDGPGLESLGDFVFRNTDIKKFHIPATLKTVGLNPFLHCSNLEKVTVEDGNTVCRVSNNMLIVGNEVVSYWGHDEKLFIDSSIVKIRDYAFFDINIKEIHMRREIADCANAFDFEKVQLELVKKEEEEKEKCEKPEGNEGGEDSNLTSSDSSVRTGSNAC